MTLTDETQALSNQLLATCLALMPKLEAINNRIISMNQKLDRMCMILMRHILYFDTRLPAIEDKCARDAHRKRKRQEHTEKCEA